MDQRRLYFLTHEGDQNVFSGYGIPFASSDKSHLLGILIIDGPYRYPKDYIKSLEDAFGEAVVGPVTVNGDIGLYTQMRISDPYSLSLVRSDLYGRNLEETRYILNFALEKGCIPKTRLKLYWSREKGLWISEFDLE